MPPPPNMQDTLFQSLMLNYLPNCPHRSHYSKLQMIQLCSEGTCMSLREGQGPLTTSGELSSRYADVLHRAIEITMS